MQEYSGKEYLQIDIANHYGLDSGSFQARIDWVNMQENRLEYHEQYAEDFFQYGAAVMAYRDAQAGKPSGYLVSMDACSSGIQILSTIIGCKVGAANSGVTGQTRKDIYHKATKVMNKLIGTDSVWERKVIKDALMTCVYGSVAEPEEAFGEDTPELEAFYKSAKAVAPGAMKLLPIMLDLWDSEALYYKHDLPDGFVSKWKVKDTSEPRVHVDTTEKELTFAYRHTVNSPLEKAAKIPAN